MSSEAWSCLYSWIAKNFRILLECKRGKCCWLHEHQGKNLHQQKDYILLKVQMIIWRRQWHPTPVFMPGKSHGWRSLVDYSPWGHEESDTNERLHFHFSLSCIAEWNGNPLQCSCPENPRDGGAWWAAIYGVAQCQTQLTWLSSSRWWLAFFSSIFN